MSKAIGAVAAVLLAAAGIILILTLRDPYPPAKPLEKAKNNICQPDGYAHFQVGDEEWTGEDIPNGAFGFASPNFFDAEGNSISLFEVEPALIAHDCNVKLTPKNAGDKIFAIASWIAIAHPEHGQAHEITDYTTNMEQCGDNYFAINGAKKCGMNNIFDESYAEKFMGKELGAAGESVEIQLKTEDNAEGFFFVEFYTGESFDLEMGRTQNVKNSLRKKAEILRKKLH